MGIEFDSHSGIGRVSLHVQTAEFLVEMIVAVINNVGVRDSVSWVDPTSRPFGTLDIKAIIKANASAFAFALALLDLTGLTPFLLSSPFHLTCVVR
jgi:hypothetical protein